MNLAKSKKMKTNKYEQRKNVSGKKRMKTNKYEKKEKMLVKIKIAMCHNTKKGKSDRMM